MQKLKGFPIIEQSWQREESLAGGTAAHPTPQHGRPQSNPTGPNVATAPTLGLFSVGNENLPRPHPPQLRAPSCPHYPHQNPLDLCNSTSSIVMCDLCITRPPAASTAGALPVPNLAEGHNRARAAGLGTSSFQSTRDAPGRGAAEPAPAAPAHPNFMRCGWPPASRTPENTWSYLCISSALAQPHMALRKVMRVSCASLLAQQSVTLRQAHPTGQVADGFDSGFCGGKQNTGLFSKFSRSFTKHRHLCFGAATCSPKHPQHPSM